MNYQALPKRNPEDPQIYARIDDDGLCRVTCTGENPDLLAWLEAGNTPEPAPGSEVTWDAIREKRDQIIRDTDWTMTPDASVDQAQWAAYRQILRDLPQTFAKTGPESVIWPEQPTTDGPNSTPVE
jgi:hypothetical protein